MNSKLKIRIIERFGNQLAFAKKINEAESVISRVIHNRQKLSQKKKDSWAEALGDRVGELFPKN